MGDLEIRNTLNIIYPQLSRAFEDRIAEIGDKYMFDGENGSVADDVRIAAEDSEKLHWRDARDYFVMNDVLQLYEELKEGMENGVSDSSNLKKRLDWQASELIRSLYQDEEYSQRSIAEVEAFRNLLNG